MRKALAAVVDDVGTTQTPTAQPARGDCPKLRVAADRLVFGDGSEDLIKILCEVFLAR